MLIQFAVLIVGTYGIHYQTLFRANMIKSVLREISSIIIVKFSEH